MNETKSPYPGIRPFRTDESDIFLGREEPITDLITKLQDHHFVVVLGESGCGKSSLIRAGLLPDTRVFGINRCVDLRVAFMRPGDEPFSNLSKSLLKEDKNPARKTLREEWFKRQHPPKGEAETVSELQQILKENLEGSYRKLEECLNEYSILLIIVDQFEELFHLSQKGERESKEVEDFIQWLLVSSYQAKSKTYVLITMRSDFFNDCSAYRGLSKAVGDGTYVIPNLNLDEEKLARAIREPAEHYNGKVEDELATELLKDVKEMSSKGCSDWLPLLQYALRGMWLKVGDAKELTLQLYKDIRGSDKLGSGLLNQDGDKVYEKATAEEKIIIEILFRRLSECVQQDDEKKDYKRHPITVEEIAKLANVIPAAVSLDIVDKKLRLDREHEMFLWEENCNFLFSRNNVPQYQLKGNHTLDIRHESIIRQWERLRQWADDEAKLARYYREWEEAARRWKNAKSDRQDELLWRGLNLENEDGRLWLDVYYTPVYPAKEQLEVWASR